jgi:DNA repair protein RadC
MPFFFGRRNETVFLLCLDAKCKVLCCREIGEGSINYAGISVRKVVETALGVSATSVVLAHNHPSGVAVPSGEDIQTTRRIAAALSAVEIHLADHIIVADNDCVSLVQSGYRFDDCMLI